MKIRNKFNNYFWNKHNGFEQYFPPKLIPASASLCSSSSVAIWANLFNPSHFFTQQFEKKLASGGQLWYESRYVVQPSQETLELFLGAWIRHFEDCLNFVWIYLYSFLTNNKAE